MKRHPLDLVSLLPGLLFAVIGLAFLSGEVDLGRVRLDLLWPVALLGIGVALLFSVVDRDPDVATGAGIDADADADADDRAAAGDGLYGEDDGPADPADPADLG